MKRPCRYTQQPRERSRSQSYHVYDIPDDTTLGRENRLVAARGYEWGRERDNRREFGGNNRTAVCPDYGHSDVTLYLC